MFKKLGILLLAVIFVAVFGGASLAQPPKPPEQVPGETRTETGQRPGETKQELKGEPVQTGAQPSTQPSGVTVPGPGAQGAGAGQGAAAGMNFKAEHNMTGTITKIDKDKDMVSLKTDEGTLMVHLPGAGQDLKEGDKITVHLGYMKGGAEGSAGQGTEKGSSEQR